VICPDWIAANSLTPLGLDLAALHDTLYHVSKERSL
jgi:hypothetical protein